MSLPKRLYFPLEVAAEKLGCTQADLIHFGATSGVEICITVQIPESEISCDDNSDNEYFLQHIKNNNSVYVDAKFNTYLMLKRNRNIYVYDFFGLMAISPQDLLSFDFTPKEKVSLVPLHFPNSNDIEISKEKYLIEPSEEIIVCFDDVKDKLFMTAAEIERISGQVSENNDARLPPKKNSRKTDNAQAKFIKSLLHIYYGADVASNPRQHLERKAGGPGVVLKDFDAAGLKAPTGVAVDNWLKFIDIDNVDD